MMNIPKGATHKCKLRNDETVYLKDEKGICSAFYNKLGIWVSTGVAMDNTNSEVEELQPINSDQVNSPTHYTQGKVECIDAIESATVGKSGFEAYCVGNIIKYLWRYEEKGGKESVEKAQWYLNKLLEQMK